jgi:lipopolysaccharide export system permease protein
MKRILSLYIVREISALFLLGIMVFTLILLMGRLLKLTDLVISRGVPISDILWMIIYLMPSLLVFTIPMAFLLAVLLAFGRLSADNEITVMKAGGISLFQLMPPVLLCGVVAMFLTLAASTVGVPLGNSAFKRLSLEVLKENVTVSIREQIFWDEIPGIVLYTEHYDEDRHLLKGVLVHDGRDQKRPLTIFAANGKLGIMPDRQDITLILNRGSIHAAGKNEYRKVNFEQYVMTIDNSGKSGVVSRNEQDMTIAELRRKTADPAVPTLQKLKFLVEIHARYAYPFAALVFAVVGMPLGMQSRRSGKSAGFSTSIAILLAYYILLSLFRTLAEKEALPPGVALWLPNMIFLAIGGLLLKMANLELGIVSAVQENFGQLMMKIRFQR